LTRQVDVETVVLVVLCHTGVDGRPLPYPTTNISFTFAGRSDGRVVERAGRDLGAGGDQKGSHVHQRPNS
jgi:hypothetical protein